MINNKEELSIRSSSQSVRKRGKEVIDGSGVQKAVLQTISLSPIPMDRVVVKWSTFSPSMGIWWPVSCHTHVFAIDHLWYAVHAEMAALKEEMTKLKKENGGYRGQIATLFGECEALKNEICPPNKPCKPRRPFHVIAAFSW